MLKFLKHLQPVSLAPKLYTEEAAAKALGVSPSTMGRLRKINAIPFVQLGGKVRYTADHIAEIINVLTVPACPKIASKSTSITFPSNTTLQSGKQPGMTTKLDKLAAHHLAQKTFKLPK